MMDRDQIQSFPRAHRQDTSPCAKRAASFWEQVVTSRTTHRATSTKALSQQARQLMQPMTPCRQTLLQSATRWPNRQSCLHKRLGFSLSPRMPLSTFEAKHSCSSSRGLFLVCSCQVDMLAVISTFANSHSRVFPDSFSNHITKLFMLLSRLLLFIST